MASEEIRRPVIDRTGWPVGPWDSEPDYEAWRSATGFPCIVRRNDLGAWCGYVGVPPEHPWHGRSPVDEQNYVDARVHGGLSYADKCDPELGVCHVPESGESDDFWWLGFDTAHGFDLVPGSGFRISLQGQAYRDLAYVKQQCENLARQAAELRR